MKLPTRWSFSSYGTHSDCPAKYKFSYIDGIEWGESPQMSRGSRQHKMAEEFVNGTVIQVPHEIRHVGPYLQNLIGYKAKTEVIWMVDQNWNPVTDPDKAWLKAIVDVHWWQDPTLFVRDYKTGRMYDDHRDQLELYGVLGMIHYPEAKRCDTAAMYFDSTQEGMESSIIRPMLTKLIETWHARGVTVMEDREWKPKPAAHCKWCPYSKTHKGGPCDAG